MFYITSKIPGAPQASWTGVGKPFIDGVIDLLSELKNLNHNIAYDLYNDGVFTFNSGLITEKGIIYKITSGSNFIYSSLIKIDENNYKIKEDFSKITGAPVLSLPAADFATWSFEKSLEESIITIGDSSIKYTPANNTAYISKNTNIVGKRGALDNGLRVNNNYSIFYGPNHFWIILRQTTSPGFDTGADMGVFAGEEITIFSDLVNQGNRDVYATGLKNTGGEIYGGFRPSIAQGAGAMTILPYVYAGVPIDLFACPFGYIETAMGGYGECKERLMTSDYILYSYNTYGNRQNWIYHNV